jgi:hypothetical protein
VRYLLGGIVALVGVLVGFVALEDGDKAVELATEPAGRFPTPVATVAAAPTPTVPPAPTLGAAAPLEPEAADMGPPLIVGERLGAPSREIDGYFLPNYVAIVDVDALEPTPTPTRPVTRVVATAPPKPTPTAKPTPQPTATATPAPTASAPPAPTEPSATTATPNPPPTATSPTPTTPPAGGEPSADDWNRLRMCESGNNYAINTGNGYYGAYQFSIGTWDWMAISTGSGLAGVLPSDATPAQQDAAALALWRYYDAWAGHNGWDPWPWCADHLGLR